MVSEPVLLLDGMPPVGAVVLERSVVEWSCELPATATAQLVIDGVTLEPFLRPGEHIWRWRWSVPSIAGEYTVRFTATWPDRQFEWCDVVQVAPSLLDAQQYVSLLADLAAIAPALAHALHGGRFGAGSVGYGVSDPAAFAALLTGSATRRLLTTIERLARRPRRQRLQAGGWHELGALRERPDPARWRPAASAAPLPNTGWPDRVWVVTPQTDPLDRGLVVAASLLDRLINLGRWVVLRDVPHATRATLVMVLGRMRALRIRLDVPARLPPSPSAWTPQSADERVLTAYRRLLRRQLGVGWTPELLSIPVRDVARLYELWCTARVTLSLLRLGGSEVLTQTLLAADSTLQITTEHPLLALALPNNTTITLRYQPRYTPDSTPFRSLDDRVRVPDLAIEIAAPNRSPNLIILDAKYRSEAGELPAYVLDEGYSYLAGLGREYGERAVSVLALLFPGHNAPITYASGLTVLPLLPGASCDHLDSWLRHNVLDRIT